MLPYFAAQCRRHFLLFFLFPPFFLFTADPRFKACPLLLFQLREYTLTESYHEDDVEMEFVSNDNLQANSETPRGIDPNRDLNEAIAEERREMDTQRYRYNSPPPSPTLFILPRTFLPCIFCGPTGSRTLCGVPGNRTLKSKNCYFLSFFSFLVCAISIASSDLSEFE